MPPEDMSPQELASALSSSHLTRCQTRLTCINARIAVNCHHVSNLHAQQLHNPASTIKLLDEAFKLGQGLTKAKEMAMQEVEEAKKEKDECAKLEEGVLGAYLGVINFTTRDKLFLSDDLPKELLFALADIGKRSVSLKSVLDKMDLCIIVQKLNGARRILAKSGTVREQAQGAVGQLREWTNRM